MFETAESNLYEPTKGLAESHPSKTKRKKENLIFRPIAKQTLTCNFIFLTVLEFILTPVSLQFVESLDLVSVITLFKLLGILSIGTLGLCAVGVILSGMASTTRGKESLLSVLLLPLVIPVIMAGTKCTVSLLSTGTLQGTFWIMLLILYSLVFLTISYLLFEFVIEG